MLIGIQLVSAWVNAYQFGAREDVSQWRAEPSTQHLCELHHPIPEYGEAIFSQRSGYALNFELNAMRPLPNTGSAELTVVAPAWWPKIATRHLGMISTQAGFQPISTAEPLAASLLDELQAGLFPLIAHEGWSKEHPVEVVISAVNFMDAYAAFQSCIAQLLPGEFSDFEHSTILFDTDKFDIKPQYQQRLNLIAAYVLGDASVQNVFLVGHADSVWKADYNKDLSKRRALAVKEYLMNQGISEAQLQVSFLGESKPVVPNNTPANRQKNRRVVISLEKDKDAPAKALSSSDGLKK
jgi:outer membrane protein OmpA-like peptidoglycan-associated protein